MSQEPQIIEGCKVICEVPRQLGRVIRLELKNGKIVAHTTSGVAFIVAPVD